jgi:2-desacetyl-2-hydroxyethyl bacteriochlorophyllide A dehydrogenase
VKAVIKKAPLDGEMELAYVDRPEPKQGEALVRVTATGICGTDVAIWRWDEAVVGQYNSVFPLVPGHEIAGTVVTPSDEPAAVAAGTPVAINPNMACRRCEHCVAGRDTLCLTRTFLGGSHNGGWAEYVVVPEPNLYSLPAGTDPAVAPLIEPLAVAAHSVLERVPPQTGDVVVIIGAGPIGLLTLILALDSGASTVFVTGIGSDEARLRLAEELGGVPINIEESDPVAAVRAVQRDGADVVYETSGSNRALKQAVDVLRRAGRISLIGLAGTATEIVTAPMVLREMTLIGARGYNATTWGKLLRVVPRIQEKALRTVSHRLPLDDYGRALDILTTTRDASKILLVP